MQIGGIASGKSTVAEVLKSKPNVQLISGDLLGHATYVPGGPAYQPLVDAFGTTIVDVATGTIDRKALGGIVFGNPDKLQQLNGIVWPAIRLLAQQKIAEIKSSQQQQPTVVVFEAAVLVEAGWTDLCQEVWCVSVSEDTASTRLQARNKISQEDALKRIRSQLSNTERERAATRVIPNEGSQDALLASIDVLWSAFTAK